MAGTAPISMTPGPYDIKPPAARKSSVRHSIGRQTVHAKRQSNDLNALTVIKRVGSDDQPPIRLYCLIL